ncbi:MAG: helix-turn-helix transcriptional regulator [Glaciimonas sp.]|nr:helix-turn-helix transcriptional regulator [Glaciimonas sp.]
MVNKSTDLKAVLAANLTALMQRHTTLNTVAEVATRSGVGRGTVDRVKKAEVATSIDVIEKLAEAFNVTPMYLLSHQSEISAPAQAPPPNALEPDELIRMVIIYGRLTPGARGRSLRFMEGEEKIAGSGVFAATNN